MTLDGYQSDDEITASNQGRVSEFFTQVIKKYQRSACDPNLYLIVVAHALPTLPEYLKAAKPNW